MYLLFAIENSLPWKFLTRVFYDFLSQRRQLSAELAHAEKEEKKVRGEEWAKRQVRCSILFLTS